MKKRLIIGVLFVVMLVLTGCFGSPGVDTRIEEIDVSTRIVRTTEVRGEQNITFSELHYIKDDKLYKVWFSEELRPALDWLHANSRPDDRVLTWWDNGHMIRGYARREPLMYSPSRSILSTVAKGKWDQEKLGPFADETLATNVAYAFLADSPTITQGVMKRNGARWIFAARADQKKIAGMTILLEEDMKEYIDDLGDPKATVRHKVIFRVSEGWPLKGLNLRYEDDYAYVYELAE
ncbi:hypothetical protein KY349_01340 [Candidatus Woesearchaeota archaeon]|jgi:hypothetical protein|nr:hypothetical protein [Candidatus Woesearchaeota archaeon]